MRNRRTISPFNLSFLDIMFCGFGAVVLLVLILDADTLESRAESEQDRRSEVMRLERAVVQAEQKLAEASNSLEQAEQELVITEGSAESILSQLDRQQNQLSRLDKDTLARIERVEQLKSDLRDLDQKNQQLGAKVEGEKAQGRKVRQFLGEGERQYLTGLKVGGQRILILVDVSASMLDETLVNIIRLRNMDEASRRSAAKWRRALAVVEWLVANLPRSSRFQMYAFNTEAGPVVAETGGKWLNSSDSQVLNQAVSALGQRIPGGGTSLFQAFQAAAKLTPRPDNILLVTDGLPTQGERKPLGSKVSAEQRLRHFKKALDVLPKGVPVNTILLPMEGDAYAAAAFWQLAVASEGSFLTPSRDWP